MLGIARGRWMLAPWAAAVAIVGSCANPLLPGFDRPVVQGPVQAHKAAALWAQGAATKGEEGRDRLWIVFDQVLDPATVHAGRFAVVFVDGSRAVPSTAHFGPADEFDELRSVVLEGEFRAEDGTWRVEQVQIFGPVFAAGGASLKGSDVQVREPGAPRLISAAWMASAGEVEVEGEVGVEGEGQSESDDCTSAWTLRTWWSDEIMRDAALAAEQLRLLPDMGEAAPALSVADLGGAESAPGSLARHDNVVDLCFDAPATGRVDVPAAMLRGLGGAPVLASSAPVAAPETHADQGEVPPAHLAPPAQGAQP